MNEQWRLMVGQSTHKGMQRRVNEDSLAIPPMEIDAALLKRKGRLYLVADGMGGHAAGKVASDLAVRRVMDEYYRDPSRDLGQSLVKAIQVANAEIYKAGQSPDYGGMGTTLVAALLRGDELLVANVGDSRAYLTRGRGIRQITRDHSWVVEQLEAGLLTKEQAREHPRRNVITRSLGSEPQVKVDLFRERLNPGDAVLLCSDGLSGLVQDEEMRRAVASKEPQTAANKLVELANRRGGYDNITSLVISLQRAPTTIEAVVSHLRLHPALLPLAGALAAVVVVLVILVASILMPTPSPATPTSTMTPTATVMATPTPMLPTPTPVPPPPKPDAVVTADALNLRAGPGTGYESLTVLKKGYKLQVVGRNQAGDWLQVISPEGVQGWVASQYTSVTLETIVLVPEVPPPTATPTPTETTTPAPTGTATPTSTDTATSTPTSTPTPTS